MRTRSVYYDFERGFIHNWLITGAQQRSIDRDQFQGEDFRQQVATQYYEPKSGITQTPVERGPLSAGLFQVGDYSGSWNYYACREDHLVEKSAVSLSPQYWRSWAYTQLVCKASQEVLLVLFTHGPTDLWLNDQHILRHAEFHGQQPGRVAFKVQLQTGLNKILVRFEAVAVRACAYAIALQVCKLVEGSTTQARPCRARDGIRVSIPTLIEATARRNKFERAAEQTYITQDVFEKNDQIRLYWPDDLEKSSAAVVRLMRPSGQIYAEATVNGTAGDQVFLQRPLEIPEGLYRILIMPLTWEYYERDLRITREINIWNAGRSPYSAAPYGSYQERRKEALVSASRRDGLFAEIAKMALNNWTALETESILQSVQINRSQELLGILGMLYRFGEHAQFPSQLRQALEDYILNFPFEGRESRAAETDNREDEQILSFAAEILAGQRFPEERFRCSGKTGQWHRQNAERLALAWLHRSAAVGFSDWDSNHSFSEYLLALSHLVDLAETEAIWEMAAVLMDKIFVTMALNSFRGVFGSTHGRTVAPFVKGGLLEPTSGIARLMWGMGAFNHHIGGTVSLACMDNYELPAMISDIAGSMPEEIWSRERHAVGTAREVNKVTYKTPDAMLCSAQDYYPGQQGCQEHIWQATLGTTATVFVTHPACTSEEQARQPNFWAGNAMLPRVAQWKDALIAVYHLPEDDWMGFTHAYFPAHAFDEYVLRQDWAFARKGNGYLALMAQQGLDLTKHGHYALRELRSYGPENIWLCHLGRAAVDGDFSSFQDKILALPVRFADTSVHFTTLRGEVLSFGWHGPFLRDEIEQPLSSFGHYEHPFATSDFPSRQMEVRYGDELLRLDFESVPDSHLK
jgi:hypothetical protein